MAFQLNLETKMTKLYNEIESDMCNKTRNGFRSSMRISEIDSPERLYSILETAEDPGSIEVWTHILQLLKMFLNKKSTGFHD